MILVAGGDSHIWGSELADSPHGGPGGYSRNTFPSLLAKSQNWQYTCSAYPGLGNSGIARAVMNSCETIDNAFVFVCWSFVNRYEFRFTYDTMPITSPWMNIHSAHTKFADSVKNKEQLATFVDIYTRHVGISEYNEIYVTLKEILFLQQYLKQRNIPYMFTTVDNKYYQHENYYRNKDATLETLYNNIDWSSWYLFDNNNGFYQWALENNYTVGSNGHPLEDAHKDAAILVKEKFDELVTKNL
jgi:hypothetical protein